MHNYFNFGAFSATCHNIYNTSIPYPLNTVATVGMRKKNVNEVFACVNVFRVFIPEQMVKLVSNRLPQPPWKPFLTFWNIKTVQPVSYKNMLDMCQVKVSILSIQIYISESP